MAHSEACDLFIEQEIEVGLEQGKTPYSIGKEVAKWIEKLFETKIKPETITKRAQRKIGTNVLSDASTQDDTQIEENKEISKGVTAEGKPRKRAKGAGRPPKFRAIKPTNRTQGTGDNDWYTPLKYIEAARQVMGGVDLDPATSEFGQGRIKAEEYYTIEMDGLSKEWNGRVWLNPPYSKELMPKFIDKMFDEFTEGRVKEAIVLTHNYTDTAWFHKLQSVACRICFSRGRIPYEQSNGTIAKPTQGAAFFYLGANPDKFMGIFGEFGFIR